MKQYFRVRLGRGGSHVQTCLDNGFIGVDYKLDEDLTGKFPDQWQDFNRQYIPVMKEKFPNRSKISLGLACGAVWVVGRSIKTGDVVLCPDASGSLHAGEVAGPYVYAPEGPLPHRRPVRWLNRVIDKSELSQPLWYSIKGPQGVVKLRDYDAEIEALLADQAGSGGTGIISPDPDVEDPAAFAMEKHLEDFLVANWSQTELGKEFKVFEEDGEMVGQQYQTDSGPADILAVSHDGARLLVVELKRGRASDVVVGQVLRYMGYVQSELAEDGQSVEGVIIALEDDAKMRRALQMVSSVRFLRYEVTFKLIGG